MNIFVLSDMALMKKALKCRCPKCGEGALYRGPWDFDMVPQCAECGFDLTKSDIGDGAAVMLIFVLGTILTPLAIWFEFAFSPPIWVHLLVWTPVSLGMTLGALKPLKSYILALQYKHRASDWD